MHMGEVILSNNVVNAQYRVFINLAKYFCYLTLRI